MKKLLANIFEFKGNIPSVCGLRIGEPYDDYCDELGHIQDKRTGVGKIDSLLEDYGAFIDITHIEDNRISRIEVSFLPYEPFDLSNMSEIASFFKNAFDYSRREINIKEDVEQYDYKYVFESNRHKIEISKWNHYARVLIDISSNNGEIAVLQGANIYYYHEPLGVYGVKDSELGLSNTKHSGKLTRDDVIENLIAAMRRDNENGDDWHFAYKYSFLHTAGTINPLDNETLEDEEYMRSVAEEMTNIYDWKGDEAREILQQAGIDELLIPVEEIFKDELLAGEITDLEEYIEEMSYEWTLDQVLPYTSLDY